MRACSAQHLQRAPRFAVTRGILAGHHNDGHDDGHYEEAAPHKRRSRRKAGKINHTDKCKCLDEEKDHSSDDSSAADEDADAECTECIDGHYDDDDDHYDDDHHDDDDDDDHYDDDHYDDVDDDLEVGLDDDDLEVGLDDDDLEIKAVPKKRKRRTFQADRAKQLKINCQHMHNPREKRSAPAALEETPSKKKKSGGTRLVVAPCCKHTEHFKSLLHSLCRVIVGTCGEDCISSEMFNLAYDKLVRGELAGGRPIPKDDVPFHFVGTNKNQGIMVKKEFNAILEQEGFFKPGKGRKCWFFRSNVLPTEHQQKEAAAHRSSTDQEGCADLVVSKVHRECDGGGNDGDDDDGDDDDGDNNDGDDHNDDDDDDDDDDDKPTEEPIDGKEIAAVSDIPKRQRWLWVLHQPVACENFEVAAWINGGSEFQIYDVKRFVKRLQSHDGFQRTTVHNSISSRLRHAGFKTAKHRHGGLVVWKHEKFVRGRLDLLQEIKSDRKIKNSNRRHHNASE